MKATNYNLTPLQDTTILNAIGEQSIYAIIDKFGRVEYANTNMCNLLGYSDSELLGEPLKLLESPLHSGLVYKTLWKKIKSKEKWNGELKAKDQYNNDLWLDTTVIPLDRENKLVYLVVCKDNTKLKLKNIALIAERNKNNMFLKSIPFRIFSISKFGKILKVNKDFWEEEVNDIIDTYIYDYIGFNCYEEFKNNIYESFKSKKARQFDFFDFDFKGAKSFYSSIVSPNFNELGEVESLTLCINDVTEFKEIDKEAEEKEAKYRLIYKSIDVGIIVVADDEGKIREWNKGAELAFGYTEREILGRPLAVLTSKTYRESSIKELANAVKLLKNNKQVDIIEMQCLKKSGKEFPVEFAFSSLTFNGKMFYCAMMLDVSDRKYLKQKLKQKTEDLELFLYRSAHDLRAPFASAKGLINLLKDETDINHAKDIVHMLDTTIDNGRTLSNNLLEASMITAKKSEFKRINFTQTINKVIKKLSCDKVSSTIDFNVDVNIERTFKSKPELIVSIFNNIIENAIKYSKPLTATHKPNIDILVNTNTKGVEIEVYDNGLGISSIDINKIFNLYYKSSTNKLPGSGLGLYIVKSIIEGLKGEIHVKSEVNYGTQFKMFLPFN